MSSSSEAANQSVQPALLSGGVLRSYQLDGLRWLKVGVFTCCFSVFFYIILQMWQLHL